VGNRFFQLKTSFQGFIRTAKTMVWSLNRQVHEQVDHRRLRRRLGRLSWWEIDFSAQNKFPGVYSHGEDDDVVAEPPSSRTSR